MDKINHSGHYNPYTENRAPQRGHRSALERALQAHRERNIEREFRTLNRMDRDSWARAQNLQETQPSLFQIEAQNQAPIPIESLNFQSPMVEEQPTMVEASEGRESYYNELQIPSVKDNAIAVIEKERVNAEPSGNEDMPKGSYVDYTI